MTERCHGTRVDEQWGVPKWLKQIKGAYPLTNVKLCAVSCFAGAVLFLQCACSSSQHYLTRGDRLAASGKYAEAALEYRNAIAKAPKSAAAHDGLAVCEMRMGQGHDALLELLQAVQLDPNREQYRVQLADLALLARQYDPGNKTLYDQIQQAADWLLARNAASFDGLRLHGDILAIDRKYTEAIAVFRKANAIRPWDPGVTLPLVGALFSNNQPQEAESLAKQTLQVHKDFVRMYDLLRQYYLVTNRIPDAEQLLRTEAASVPKEAAAIIQLAELYRKSNRQSDVAAELNKILTAPRDFPNGALLVGDYYARAGQWDQALAAYERGQNSPATQKALYDDRITTALVAEGKRAEALRRLDESSHERPNDISVRLLRDRVLQQSADPKEIEAAAQDLQRLAQENPRIEAVHYMLGRSFLKQGKTSAAREQLLLATRLNGTYLEPKIALAELAEREANYSEMIRISEEVLASDPNNQEAKILHAAGLVGTRSFRQAQNELAALEQASPGSEPVQLEMAELESARKDLSGAEARLKKIYRAGSPNLGPLEALTKLYIQERQPDKAVQLIQQEIAQSPDSNQLHSLLASAYMAEGKSDLAIGQYEWIRSRNADSVEALVALGDLYSKKGDVAKALEHYEAAGKLAPDNAKILASMAFLENTSGMEKDAIPNLEKLLQLEPGNFVAMNDLAFALAETGVQLDRALALAEAAQRKLSNNAAVADTIAWVYARKGLNESAITILRGLVKKYPNEPLLRYHLGVALLQSGKSNQAKAELLTCLSEKPPKKVADTVNRLVAKIG